MVWLFGRRGDLKDRVMVMVRWLARKGKGLINSSSSTVGGTWKLIGVRWTMDIMWMLIRLFLLKNFFPRIMSCLQPSCMMVRGLYQDLNLKIVS